MRITGGCENEIFLSFVFINIMGAIFIFDISSRSSLRRRVGRSETARTETAEYKAGAALTAYPAFDIGKRHHRSLPERSPPPSRL
jgi:hypothetical protein